MVGIFKVTDPRDGVSFCVASANACDGVNGRFYIPPLYRDAVARLARGDSFFGLLDTVSGYGAILYKLDDGVADGQAVNVSHALNVGDGLTVGKECTVRGGLSVDGSIVGGNASTQIFLTSEDTAGIVAAGASGAPLVLNVSVKMGGL